MRIHASERVMTKKFQFTLLVTVFLAGVLGAKNLYANERSTFPVAYFDIEYGLFTTYKSSLIDFNDTGVTTAYSFGSFAGDDRIFGFSVRNETLSITFSPSSATASTIDTTWQDTGIKYRLGFMFLGFYLVDFCKSPHVDCP